MFPLLPLSCLCALCMECWMLYIVLQDVISTMFSTKFIGELFKPQKIYTSTATREIFDRLAHSSIMRLNQSSMDKLYDLMTMGCKYQVISCSAPQDLHQVCLNHLDALRIIVKGNADVTKLIENCDEKLTDVSAEGGDRDTSGMENGNIVANLCAHFYCVVISSQMFYSFRISDYYLLRSTLCRFFQDRRVKVSLFLQDHLQAQDGSIIHHSSGKMSPDTEIPGPIRYFDGQQLRSENYIELPNAFDCIIVARGIDINKPGRPCELGTNLYAKDRRKKAALSTPTKGPTKGSPPPQPGFEPDPAAAVAAKHELNFLASMIGGSRAKETEKFSIVNLFPDASDSGGSSSSGYSHRYGNDVITIDGGDGGKRMKQLEKQFQGLGKGHDSEGEQDDLLDLMDKHHGSGVRSYDDDY